MKITVLDGFTENPGDLSWAPLEELGDLTVYDRTSVTDIVEITARIGDAEAVYTNKTPLSEEVFERCPSIRFVCVLATGYNVADTEAAAKRGIPVCNVPAYGTEAVGQFAIALLLEICHRIGHHDRAVHEGRWAQSQDFCFWDYPLIELQNKTIGIIGFGKIGQVTGRIAKSMGMRVLASGSRPSEQGRAIAEYVSTDEIFAESDVIALHCPLLPETEGFINKDSIAKMKDGVIIINNGRGKLIEERDLAQALDSGKVYAAGLDVASEEPIRADNPLLKAKNCIITPHISWASKESRQRLMDVAVENLRMFIAGSPINVVNA
ncbi:MAG: D-2-hydroxyacid dehydrogenase [Clostridiales Family XIII bacterium]|jgi:glycerate dehydrogenase|nr:D-2-hydroxyacid dehydrogenase [Clostridiales Family XIII bacterium]